MEDENENTVSEGFYAFVVLVSVFGTLGAAFLIVNVIKEVAAWMTLIFN